MVRSIQRNGRIRKGVSQMKSLFFQKDLFFRTRIMRTSYDKKSHISNNNVYIIHMVSLSLQFDKHSFFVAGK